jgi:tRNA threonylcarbamoyl adenosine modification protein YeaZ
MPERILAVETSSAWTSLAVADDGVVIAEAEHQDPRGHVEAIGVLYADAIAPVLRDSPVTGVVCGVGPGPYSGLRVGIAYARALGLAWAVPIAGICSLDAVAASNQHEGNYVVVADARRREVYWAVFDPTGARIDGPYVGAPTDIPAGLPVVDVPAHARDLIAYLAARGAHDPARWEPTPIGIELDDHGDAGARTARALAGGTLLTAQPLYLRAADVTVSPRASHPVTAGVTWT